MAKTPEQIKADIYKYLTSQGTAIGCSSKIDDILEDILDVASEGGGGGGGNVLIIDHTMVTSEEFERMFEVVKNGGTVVVNGEDVNNVGRSVNIRRRRLSSVGVDEVNDSRRIYFACLYSDDGTELSLSYLKKDAMWAEMPPTWEFDTIMTSGANRPYRMAKSGWEELIAIGSFDKATFKNYADADLSDFLWNAQNTCKDIIMSEDGDMQTYFAREVRFNIVTFVRESRMTGTHEEVVISDGTTSYKLTVDASYADLDNPTCSVVQL